MSAIKSLNTAALTASATSSSSISSSHITPRTEYARARRQLNTKLQNVLTTLDSDAIERIRNEFTEVMETQHQLSLPEFVRVLKENIAWQAPVSASSSSSAHPSHRPHQEPPSAGRSSGASHHSAHMTEQEFVQAVIELYHAVDVNGAHAIKFDDFLSTISMCSS
jgi:hypothetical protein